MGYSVFPVIPLPLCAWSVWSALPPRHEMPRRLLRKLCCDSRGLSHVLTGKLRADR